MFFCRNIHIGLNNLLCVYLSNLDLKLLTDSADTTLSGKLFHTDTIPCEK